MSDRVASNMAYIQQLFMTVQDDASKSPGGAHLFSYLDAEPAEFRSIAYESASVEIGIKDIQNSTSFVEWQKFYQYCRDQHSFHVQIGLGWAFAKTEIFPDAKLAPQGSVMRLMLYDGIGYFNALFRGRKTIRQQLIPEGIHGNDQKGFDQGVGRRLWYMSEGNVDKVSDSIMTFQVSRRHDLWRGVGIACGYVGGNTLSSLQALSDASGIHGQQLSTGILLAACSRIDSHSITPEIELACDVICKVKINEAPDIKNKLMKSFVFDRNDSLTEKQESQQKLKVIN